MKRRHRERLVCAYGNPYAKTGLALVAAVIVRVTVRYTQCRRRLTHPSIAAIDMIDLSFSHVGFYVFDLPLMEAFYTRLLGFCVTDRGVARGRDLVFLSRDRNEHHQIVLVAGRVSTETTVNQISFRLRSLEDLQRMALAVRADPGVSDVMGTDHGTAWSLYFRDPEGNRIELFVTTPWYVRQPRVEPLDLTRPVAQIVAATEAACRSDPSFRPAQEWSRDFAVRLTGANEKRTQ
jgi:catechol 2,3-dioxygenase